VTAKDQGRGFYLQTEPSKVDKIDSTSEGLYVRPDV
jgi:predicted extracellular nuclease